MMEASDKPSCPVCGRKDQVIPIVYGEPSPEDMERAERGEIMLAGVLRYADAPTHYCRRCAHFFGKVKTESNK
ncbi:MAG: hypothetical protein DRQ06_05435 [Candidatus Hydrothermota bacterium]|uniref:Uncharacterized protein n=1 Tax=candidate division WOR-3 bacterium TaxID=2052148 RepID=A0A7C1B9P7_UNCW3|nr:MAG: hypothetical protein DRQ06_05435 [Candidatus Hydrothermae bacterium]RKY99575.1 MAG: hypothetical protein DRQ04_07320 [Candidatus Hydrothermae bacterium]HDM89831.1 hypothetical protein [candidate division WOR-3 bacterium]